MLVVVNEGGGREGGGGAEGGVLGFSKGFHEIPNKEREKSQPRRGDLREAKENNRARWQGHRWWRERGGGGT